MLDIGKCLCSRHVILGSSCLLYFMYCQTTLQPRRSYDAQSLWVIPLCTGAPRTPPSSLLVFTGSAEGAELAASCWLTATRAPGAASSSSSTAGFSLSVSSIKPEKRSPFSTLILLPCNLKSSSSFPSMCPFPRFFYSHSWTKTHLFSLECTATFMSLSFASVNWWPSAVMPPVRHGCALSSRGGVGSLLWTLGPSFKAYSISTASIWRSRHRCSRSPPPETWIIGIYE